MKFDLRNTALALILAIVLLGLALTPARYAATAESVYNYIDNGGFERADYTFGGQSFGRWYNYGCQISTDGNVYHTGERSLKVSAVPQSGAAYRLPLSSTYEGWIYGLEHKLSAWVYSDFAIKITFKIELTLWTGSNHVAGFYITKSVDCTPSAWVNLDLPFNIEKSGAGLKLSDNGSEALTSNGSLAAVDIFILAEENVVFYIDDASLAPDVTDVDAGKNPPSYIGNGENIQGTGSLGDSGFESGAFAQSFSENLWSPSGAFTRLSAETAFTYAGEKSMKISGRTTADSSALIRMNMATYFKDGKKYYFRAKVSSLSNTTVLFKVRVYGYDGKAYPDKYVPIATANTVNGAWSDITGHITVAFESTEERIRVETKNGTEYVENVLGVSSLEFYFCTVAGSENETTTLYVDNCYFSLLDKTIVPKDFDVQREGDVTVGSHPIYKTTTYKTEVKGVTLGALGVSVGIAILSYIAFSIVFRIYKKRTGDKENA